MEYQRFIVKSPKETLREAYKNNYIEDARVFLDALQRRNELSHDYNEETFETAEDEIRETFFPAFEKLYQFYINQIKKDQTGLFDE